MCFPIKLIFLIFISSKATNVLQLLGKVAAYALTLTSFFYCQTTPTLRPEESLKWQSTEYVFHLFQIFNYLLQRFLDKNNDISFSKE